jgi:hypothetical protein
MDGFNIILAANQNANYCNGKVKEFETAKPMSDIFYCLHEFPCGELNSRM